MPKCLDQSRMLAQDNSGGPVFTRGMVSGVSRTLPSVFDGNQVIGQAEYGLPAEVIRIFHRTQHLPPHTERRRKTVAAM